VRAHRHGRGVPQARRRRLRALREQGRLLRGDAERGAGLPGPGGRRRGRRQLGRAGDRVPIGRGEPGAPRRP
jgi:hypothetical protein